MSDNHPTRRQLMRPVQLLGLSALAAVFAGLVALLSMGFFQQRFKGESMHAVEVALIVAGITFIATIVIISLLLLAVKPEEFTTTIDKPVLISHEEAAAEHAHNAAAAKNAKRTPGTTEPNTEPSAESGSGSTDAARNAEDAPEHPDADGSPS